MAEFTASPIVAAGDPNVLWKAQAAGDAQYTNQLLNQGKQLDLSNANMEQVSRLAAGLRTIQDPAERASAYARGVGFLQSQGFALHAPATLPDDQQLQLLSTMGTASADLYKLQLGQQAGQALIRALTPTDGSAASTATPGGTTAQPASPGTAPAPGAAAAPSTIEPTALASATAVRDGLIKRGVDPVTATAFAANKLHESGGTLDSGPGDGGASQGNFMWNGDRNTEYQQLYGHTPQGAPLDEQLDFVMHELNGKESNARDAINAAEGVDGKAAAISRYYLRPKDVVGEVQRRSATALQLQRQLASTAQPGAPGGAVAPGVVMGDATRPDLAPPPPGGTAGIPAPYQATGGGVGAVLGGAARVARPTSPAGAPIVTDQPAGGGVVAGPPGTAVVGAPTPPSAAVPGNVGAINAGIARAGGVPAAAAQPEPGWGTAIGTYGPQNQLAPTPPPPAPTPPASTPPAVSTAPAQPVPAPASPAAVLAPPTSITPVAPQMVTPSGQTLPAPPGAPALLSNGLTPQQWAVVQAEALRPGADLNAIAGQVMTLANTNRAAQQQAWQDAHPDLHFEKTATGAVAMNPKTGQVVGQYTYQPSMQSRAVEGSASWDGSKWVPAVPGQPSVPGRWVYSGTNRGDFQPAASQPATASFDLQKELYKRDTDQLPEYNTQNQQAAANQIRIQQMRELVDQVSSGAGGAERANWANIADTLGWHDLAKQLAGMGGAAAAQEFAKYGLATAGAQERGDLGARGSLGAISLYKSANPGLELQPDANKKMLTAQLVAAQANRDYTQQAMDYVNSNSGQFLHGGTYTPLSHFDAEWAAARNAQIYAAAMGAINGDPWEKWTKALNMKNPDDVQRVIGVVRRADPTSSVMWNNGQPHAVGTGQ